MKENGNRNMKEDIITGLFLGICSWQDIRKKQVSVKLLNCFMAAALLMGIWNVLENRAAWWEIPAGILPGGILFIYSRLTEGKLGEADGWVVAAMGVLQQWRRCTGILMMACFLVFIYSAFLLVLKKGSRKTQIPFIPFLAGGFILLWIRQGGR